MDKNDLHLVADEAEKRVTMRVQYYRAAKRIDKTALLEFLKKITVVNEDVEIKVSEVSGIIFLKTSHTNLLISIDELYPNIFKPSGPPLLEGIVLFNNL
jgi:hypothetical protein